MSLESYGDFKSITTNLDKKTVKKDFWGKERTNISTLSTKSKEEKKSMKMTTQKFHQTFSL